MKTVTHNVIFQSGDTGTIRGYQQECQCAHCGRNLKVGILFEEHAGAFGAQCVASAIKAQKAHGYTQKLGVDGLKKRAIVAQKGADYAWDTYGWRLGGPVFRVEFKTELADRI